MDKGKSYNKIVAKDNMKVADGDDRASEEIPERKELKKLISKQPKKVKKSLFSRLISGILGPEGVSGIGQYVAEEIILPSIRNIIYDAINSSARMALFKDGGGPTGNRHHQNYLKVPSNNRPATNYTSRYTSSQPAPSERNIARAARYGVEEYLIEDRFDAAHVLTTLTENADMYDKVSVADYYDLINVPSQYTDNSYGWTIDSIVRATIVPVRGGYIIKFPPAEVV